MPARIKLSVAPALIALTALLASCEEPVGPGPLEGSALTGEYDLVDARGRAVADEAFEGKYQLIYFGYASCPNICPFDVQRMMRGFDQYAADHPDEAARIQPIFITVDPERDTPAKVGEFAAAFSDRLIGLTGTREQVDAAMAAFSVYAVKGEADATGYYDYDHSGIGYLVGPDGEPIATIPVDQNAEAVAAELAKWVR